MIARVWTWFLAGFPSPWRALRRWYWARRYAALPCALQEVARWGRIDPPSLIERGEL
jgi:hypothetical protein